MTIPGQAYFERLYTDRDWRMYRAILAKVIEHSEPGPILDAGAGPGFFVEAALRFGLDCEGIDGSPEAIGIARRRYPPIRLQQHDLAAPLPYDDCAFRTVVLNQVIGALGNDVATRALREIRRILCPGGMLFVASPNRLARDAFADPSYVQLYTPTELEAMLVDAGFTEVTPLNTPRLLLGTGRLGVGVMTALLRLTTWDRLSADSRCLAYRPRQDGLAMPPR